MGEINRYECTKCDYEANVSGGYDCGFVSETVTIHCKTCKEILDAFLNRDEAFDGNWDKVQKLKETDELFKFFKCPKSRTKIHKIEPWGRASKVKRGNWICPNVVQK